jgi:ribulose-phosphate 3-epimerase
MGTWRDWVRSAEIEPSVYAADFAQLGTQIGSLLKAGARVFHFDVADGHFVEPITIGPIVFKDVAPLVHEVGGAVDVHLMVSNPERHFRQVKEAGGDSVTFHVEASDDPARTMARARQEGLCVGVAFNPETPVEEAAAAAIGADLVLCMGINPGYSGQTLLPEAVERVRELRRLLPKKLIQIDGGVTEENIREIHAAGADVIVAGSAVFHNGDLPHPYLRLLRALG